MTKKRKIEMPYPIAVVLWEDSFTLDTGIVSPVEFKKPENCEFYMATVGWVIRDDKKGMALVYTIRQDGNADDENISIPRSAIRFVEYVR